MKQIVPAITLLTIHENEAIYLQNLVISHARNNFHLPGRTGDNIYVFTESICLYVLSINRTLHTMGLFAFMAPEPDCINAVILHSPGEIREMLGTTWERLSPLTITTKLIEYLM